MVFDARRAGAGERAEPALMFLFLVQVSHLLPDGERVILRRAFVLEVFTARGLFFNFNGSQYRSHFPSTMLARHEYCVFQSRRQIFSSHSCIGVYETLNSHLAKHLSLQNFKQSLGEASEFTKL
uniref:Uncharacterized protein n=1 Tax=Ixodes ricinus TaxID=34613 RepID=A0A6B0UP01_IXORI